MTASTAMLAFPIRFEAGKAVTVERDSYEEIAQGIEIVCRTLRGKRIERPEFGLRSFLFEEPIALQDAVQHVEAAALDADARASVVTESDTSDLEAMILTVGVTIEEGPTNG